MRDWKFHCAILGVKEDATAKEMRRAFRRLALERHPDKHQNSTQSKEEFQQLNESYRYLLSALAEGRRPSPAPQPAPRSTERRAPEQMLVTRKAPSPPARRELPKPTVNKLWLHALIACAVVTVVPLAFELNRAPEKRVSGAQGDLSLRSWCKITGPSGQLSHEYLSEPFCQERCRQLASRDDGSCAWNGVEFRSAKNAAPAGPKATLEDGNALTGGSSQRIERECQISLERSDGQVTTSPSRTMSEKGCLNVCQERAETFRRAGVRCSWGGNEIFTQALYQPKDEVPPLPAPYAQPYPAASAAGELTSTCYMTVAMPGNISAVPYPNETKDSCLERCQREFTAHPLDREVTCSFNGRPLAKHIPDPLESYLAQREPADAAEIQAGASTVALCEIYGTAGGHRVLASTAASSRSDCESRCKYEFDHSLKNMEFSCAYAKKEFFRKTVP